MSTLFVSDLDGTLLNSNHCLSPETVEAINQIYAHGDHFAIATGRHHKDVHNVAKVIGGPVEMISSNGAVVSNSQGVTLVSHFLPPEVTKELVGFELPDTMYLNVYTENHWYVLHSTPELESYSVEGGLKVEEVPVDFLEKQRAIKMFIWSGDTPENRKMLGAIQTEMNSEFGSDIDCFFSHPLCLEVMPKGVSKGAALHALSTTLSYEPKDIVAFGDGENDIDMLQYAGVAVIMKNSADRVKEVLDEALIIGHAHEDGVADYLNQWYEKK